MSECLNFKPFGTSGHWFTFTRKMLPEIFCCIAPKVGLFRFLFYQVHKQLAPSSRKTPKVQTGPTGETQLLVKISMSCFKEEKPFKRCIFHF
jgi:hypothetical protein